MRGATFPLHPAIQSFLLPCVRLRRGPVQPLKDRRGGEAQLRDFGIDLLEISQLVRGAYGLMRHDVPRLLSLKTERLRDDQAGSGSRTAQRAVGEPILMTGAQASDGKIGVPPILGAGPA